jgi:hypothetical protein
MVKKKNPHALNALQLAQLNDCREAGCTLTVNHRPKKEGQQPKPAPLFFPETEQTKLF